jgi:hypothetical protein
VGAQGRAARARGSVDAFGALPGVSGGGSPEKRMGDCCLATGKWFPAVEPRQARRRHHVEIAPGVPDGDPRLGIDALGEQDARGVSQP